VSVRRTIFVAALVLLASCAKPTEAWLRVRVGAIAVPEGAALVGTVRVAEERWHLVGGLASFRKRVSELGGDFGLVDRIEVTFRSKTHRRTWSGACAERDALSCVGSQERRFEGGTIEIVGRAYRLRGAPP
jgi:hypothetical protein